MILSQDLSPSITTDLKYNIITPINDERLIQHICDSILTYQRMTFISDSLEKFNFIKFNKVFKIYIFF